MMTEQLLLLQLIAVAACLVMGGCYLFVRPTGESAIDGFAIFFLIQYGPHTLWTSSFHRLNDYVSEQDTAQFLIGMSIAYMSIAVAILVTSRFRFDALAERSFPIQTPSTWILLAVSLVYIVPFLATQGPTLPVTGEYVRSFLGQSSFEYSEVRRELFAGSLYEKLGSLTRQTSTAILFSFIFSRIIARPSSRWTLIPCACALFVLCAMQMNKFPFVYYFGLVVLAYLTYQSQRGNSTATTKKILALGVGGIISVIILMALYQFQYDRSASDVQNVIAYRLFYCTSDALRMWYDYFPHRQDFLGFAGIPITAKIFGLPYVNPTVAVPESLATGVLTSYQCGFIGSGYAGYGLFGVAIYSYIAATIAMLMANFQRAFRHDAGATCFLSVLTLNSFFLTTRELHTAMLSGGTISVLLLFIAIHVFYPRKSRTDE